MTKEEILIARKDRNKDHLKFKVCNREVRGWSPSRYEKIIASKDYNLLALLFYDLNAMGYNVEKAFTKFKELVNEPDLFFLK